MNKKISGLLLMASIIVSSITHTQAQLPKPGYFQQRVNYTIHVRLDDEHNILHCYEVMEYINHSPNTLNEIYIHLWPNAYKNRKTAFCKQRLQEGKTDFYYAKEKNKGWIDSLDFKIDETSARWQITKDNPDIAIIYLNKGLAPGQSIKITTPFRVKIPIPYSRMGQDEQGYQISQWYPKPAVYDAHGWNPIPYLDQGEFYSEYGKFDVSITLPKNYRVAATGRLQNKEELLWMDSIAAKNISSVNREKKNAGSGFPIKISTNGGKSKMPKDEIPPSLHEWKTLRYVQDSVHDFAWFADKKYIILKKDTTLPVSGRLVHCYSMFKPSEKESWQLSDVYVARAVQHYSKYVGDYPYDYCTAVSGSLMEQAGGMEYPMVTVISTQSQLETVILHEVGHNWFYGIFGSNERNHGWMDEGINSFYEALYTEKNSSLPEIFKEVKGGLKTNFSMEKLTAIGAYIFDRIGEAQPLDIPSAEFSSINYGIYMYGKTARVIQMLRSNMGEEKYDSMMHLYFKTWGFHHPQPEDFYAFFARDNAANAIWLKEMITTTKRLDYTISKADAKGNITLKNVGGITAPVLVAGFRSGEAPVVKSFYSEDKKFSVQLPEDAYTSYMINPFPAVPDFSYTNNSYYLSPNTGRFKMPRLKPFFSMESNTHTNILYSPIIAWNYINGFMGGVAFYNDIVAPKSLTYKIIPLLSMDNYNRGANPLTGIADLAYTFLPYHTVYTEKIVVGAVIKSFGISKTSEKVESYISSKFSVDYHFKNKARREPFIHEINLATVGVNNIGNSSTQFSSLTYNVLQGNSLTGGDFHLKLENIYPVSYKPSNGSGHNKISLNYSYHFLNPLFKQKISIHLFAGKFLSYDPAIKPVNYGFQMSGSTGSNDYTNEEWYLDRSGKSTFWGNQIGGTEHGFKHLSDTLYAHNWLTTFTLTASLVKNFRWYADLGLIPDAGNKPNFYWGTGISYHLLKDYITIYMPIAYSQNLSNTIKFNYRQYYKFITFRINLNALYKFNPTQLMM